MCIHVWIEKAAIDFTISRPRKSDVGPSEKLIDGRMATAYLHNPNASADWRWPDICAHLKCTEYGSVGWIDPRPNWSEIINFDKATP
jgi:hypothetical protein